MQNSRELIDHLLRNEPAERVGVLDHPWWDTLEKWVDEGYPVDSEGKPVNAVDHFGFDMCGVGGWFDVLPFRGFSEVVEETDEWEAKRNGAGAVLKYWKHKDLNKIIFIFSLHKETRKPGENPMQHSPLLASWLPYRKRCGEIL